MKPTKRRIINLVKVNRKIHRKTSLKDNMHYKKQSKGSKSLLPKIKEYTYSRSNNKKSRATKNSRTGIFPELKNIPPPFATYNNNNYVANNDSKKKKDNVKETRTQIESTLREKPVSEMSYEELLKERIKLNKRLYSVIKRINKIESLRKKADTYLINDSENSAYIDK